MGSIYPNLALSRLVDRIHQTLSPYPEPLTLSTRGLEESTCRWRRAEAENADGGAGQAPGLVGRASGLGNGHNVN